MKKEQIKRGFINKKQASALFSSFFLLFKIRKPHNIIAEVACAYDS